MGLGGRGRRTALATEAARVIYAAVFKVFMLLQFVTCVCLIYKIISRCIWRELELCGR